MPSYIDINMPSGTAPTTASVRENFRIARDEIQALQGSIGGTGPTGATGQTGPTGATGATMQGPTGQPGPTGASGARWLTGTIAPATGTGAVGDWYINTTDSQIYEKTGVTMWTPRGTLRGTTGATGATGTGGATAVVHYGATPPPSPVDGMLWWDTTASWGANLVMREGAGWLPLF